MRRFTSLDKKAFSIVELLVVFVVIGILVAIGTVVYSGVTNRANVVNIQSDLDANASKLQLYYAAYGSYPTTLDANKCPSAPIADTNYCLKLSTNNTVNTYSATASTYTLNIANGSLCYRTTESTTPTNACSNAGTSTYAVTSTGGNNIQTYVANGVDGISGQSYKYHTFTSSGTLTVTTAGFADIVVVGGGGAGGSRPNGYTGGGGAGGALVITDAYLPVGTLTVTVGAGGTGNGADRGLAGYTSRLGQFYAVGGGGGGGESSRASGGSGGSGGGGQGSTAELGVGGFGVVGLGNNGGASTGTTSGGSGGGAGAAGGTGGAAGGAGITTSIAGTTPSGAYVAGTYAFSGGGGGSPSGAGGLGGGGAAGNPPVAGTANTGGGGGGVPFAGALGGNGGSGIVIVRVRL